MAKNYKTVWNLSPLFESDNDPEIAKKRKIVERESYKFINKWKKRDDYLRDPKVLKKALNEYERWLKNYGTSGDEGYYFELRTAQDQNSPALKAKFNKAVNFSNKIQNDIQFFTLEIAKVNPKLHSKFLQYKELKQYRHFLEKLFREAKYLLSDPEEKIINLKNQTSHSNWVKMLSGFLSKEERKILLENRKRQIQPFSEIISLMSSKRKKVRDNSAKVFNEILEKHLDVAESELNSVLANKKVDDELRKLPRADSARHIADDVETKVVDTLIAAVTNRFNIAKKYYKLKAKLVGVPQLKYHERNVEYGKIDKKYTYDASLKIIFKVIKGLDEEFTEIFTNFVNNRQIDVYPKKGKQSGASAHHNLISQPTYLLLNHADKLDSILTFAHELGHGINNELIKKEQNALNFGTPLSTGEVASTFMEDFVFQELLKGAAGELKLSLMMAKLNQDVSSIFRQIAFYNFETGLHKKFREKGYLSKEEIGKLFQKHTKSYMGPYVEQSAGSENWWIYVSHFRYFFYVYSYASGLLISKSLQVSVKNDPKYIEKVKKFLSTGLSDSPKNIFAKLGVDITNKKFWDKGIDEVDTLLKETEKLAKKLGKI